MTLRLALVTDIHHGPPSASKVGHAALAALEEFAAFVADLRPLAVFDLGDRITDVNPETDQRHLAEVAEAFRGLAVPHFHLDGNHDLAFLSDAENAAALGQALGHATIDLEGWRIVLWRADARIRRTPGAEGFVLLEGDLVWLARTILAADRPLLVLSHVPVSGQGQVGNYYFENDPHLATYPGAGRIRAALSRARVPVVCLAGHVHWNSITTVDGIVHLTQQSLTESFTTEGVPAMAMGWIELGDTVRWEVIGRDPIVFQFRPEVRRWLPPLPDFRTHPGLAHAQAERAP